MGSSHLPSPFHLEYTLRGEVIPSEQTRKGVMNAWHVLHWSRGKLETISSIYMEPDSLQPLDLQGGKASLL